MSSTSHPKTFSLCYSLSDQSFARTKSVGIFNLSLGLLKALAERPELGGLHVLSNSEMRNDLPRQATFQVHDGAMSGGMGRILWDQWSVCSAAARTRSDWLFLPKGFASFIRRPGMKLAAYVHDTIQEFYREHHPSAVSGLEQAYFQRSFVATLRRANVIFTNSDFTAAEVRAAAARRGIRCPEVVTAGIGFERPQVAEERNGRIVVLTGRFPHKLTRQAVDWMGRWSGGDGPGVDWVGGMPAGVELPAKPGWKRHQRLPEAEFRGLLAAAQVVVFFSEYEGFGMPPVEATLAGSRAVYSAIPATTEVMGRCGFAFDNGDYADFAKAMDAAMATGQNQVEAWAKELLERHDWSLVAGRVAEVLVRA